MPLTFPFNLFKQKKPPQLTEQIFLSGGSPVFTPFNGNAYENDLYRAAVDAIARNAAKLRAAHVILDPAGRSDGDPVLNRLLQSRPNPFMSAFDLLYKLVTHLYLNNNAFAWLQWADNGNLAGIYPLKPNNAEFMAAPDGTLYVNFNFGSGQNYQFPYSDVIHIRRHFNRNDLLGDQNTALIPALELAHTQNEGIINGIKFGANIRGVLKITRANLRPEDVKAQRDNFMRDFLEMTNSGGLVVTDTSTEYSPLESKPYIIDNDQLEATKAKIYDYLGISEVIVNNTYNENQWNAFYESVIESIAVQLSLEFTEKLFTAREQAFGNAILFEANRLQFASATTKATLIEKLMPFGLLTINQALEILNLPGMPDGDKRLQTLNMVNAAKADQYQLGGDAQL